MQVFQGRPLSQAFYQFAVMESRNSRDSSQWDFSFPPSVCQCFWQDGKEKLGLILQTLLMGMGTSKEMELPA